MTFISNNFNVTLCKLTNDNYLHLLDIEEIDSKFTNFLDQKISEICEGYTDTPLNIIKIRLIKFLKTKRNSGLEIGAIAEFFTHLYLNEIGFKQEFLFFNLEEGSIKKGFDGYYSFINEEWIYESKSGSIETKKISHSGKIKEAYNDLVKTIAGKKKNNPWQNAYSHASQIDVHTNSSIRANLKKLSNEFVLEKYHDIKDFNVIPGSTLFLEEKFQTHDPKNMNNIFQDQILKFNFKKIQIICVNQKSVDIFWDYLTK
jgi:hypothetical protein